MDLTLKVNASQAGRLASEQVESAVAAAEEGFKEGNTLEATAKAAVAAWRSAQVTPASADSFKQEISCRS